MKIICQDLPGGDYCAYEDTRPVDLVEERYTGCSPDEAIGHLVRAYLNIDNTIVITDIIRLNCDGDDIAMSFE